MAEHFDSAIQSPADDPEERGFVCGRSNTRDAWYCSFHITSKQTDDRYYQEQQIAHMRIQSGTWRNNGRATVMMGDFNVVPDVSNPQIGMGFWYQTHVESDNCSQNVACKKTHDIQPGDLAAQNRKYDYIFAHDFYCDRQGAEPAVRRYGNLSDHAFVRGYIICPN